MTNVRMQKLESIGFQRSLIACVTQKDKTNDKKWNVRFHQLEAYKAKHGHCNFPTKSGKLGKWIGTQRQYYRDYPKKEIL
mmetsp:Transcript_3969/g.6058  ORF Transcript_3969/g.6058 Transcript_3969/m.6058 type:complete len:80 (-) Transcript_3969:125-364(-)